MTDITIEVPQAGRYNIQYDQQKENGKIRVYEADPKWQEGGVVMVIESGPREFRQRLCLQQALKLSAALNDAVAAHLAMILVPVESTDQGVNVDRADGAVATA